jgi:methylglutaconyl-CoA hydratase
MSHVEITSHGPVTHVTLNRPEVRNAFNEELIAELTGWAESVTSDGTTRVAVISGAGKTFCAGADLAWMSKMVGYSHEENVRDARAAARMFEAVDRLPIPLVGRIHGAALGGGCGLAAVCDIAVAGEDAVFGFTEGKLGILPAMIAPYAIAKIGQSAARDLFLTARRFSAVRALEIGLVHAIVPEADLDRYINDSVVAELLTSAPRAVSAAKQLIAAVAGRPVRDVADLTAETIARHRVSAEGQEGMHAFLEKRKPSWTA